MSPADERQRFLFRWRTVLMLLGTNSVIVLFFLLDEMSHIDSLKEGLLVFLYLQLLIQPIGFCIAYIANLIPFEKIHSIVLRFITGISATFIAGWIGTVIGKLLLFWILREAITFPTTWQAFWSHSFYFLFFGLLSSGFYTLREKLKATANELAEKKIQEERLKQSKIEAELDALRAKVNPHFLFNTLNSISSLIPQDPEAAEDMVGKLAALFRHALDSQRKMEIPLSEEIEVIEKYLEIEKIRLGNRLTYTVHMDSVLDKAAILPLLLQPIVENAVKHGIAPRTDGGEISISGKADKEVYQIQIRDTGTGYDPIKVKPSSYGLKNVRERLNRFYPNAHQFDIHGDEGTTVTLQLPLKIME